MPLCLLLHKRMCCDIQNGADKLECIIPCLNSHCNMDIYIELDKQQSNKSELQMQLLKVLLFL